MTLRRMIRSRLRARFISGLAGNCGSTARSRSELGAPPLPRVTAVVNAHHALTGKQEEPHDGILNGENSWPFQGGHYRLASRKYDIAEDDPVSPEGEIHFGPGRQLWQHGALEIGIGSAPFAARDCGCERSSCPHRETRRTPRRHSKRGK